MGKFNVGDKVRCILMESFYGDKLEIGGIYTVKAYQKSYPDFLKVEENGGINDYEEKCFELVEPAVKKEKPAPKFMVGERVKVNGDMSHSGLNLKGRIGCITEIGTFSESRKQYYYCLDIEKEIDFAGGIWEHELERVLEPVVGEIVETKPKKLPLAPGDKVAVYGIDNNFQPIRVVSEVEHIYDDGAIGLEHATAFKEKEYDFTIVHAKQCRRLGK
jgi:hypothetical protein